MAGITDPAGGMRSKKLRRREVHDLQTIHARLHEWGPKVSGV
jgi:hypothetical protein